jgi:hypothetical protein
MLENRAAHHTSEDRILHASAADPPKPVILIYLTLRVCSRSPSHTFFSEAAASV